MDVMFQLGEATVDIMFQVRVAGKQLREVMVCVMLQFRVARK